MVARHSASFSSLELYQAAQTRAAALGMKFANYLEYAVAKELDREVEQPDAAAQESLPLEDEAATEAAA